VQTDVGGLARYQNDYYHQVEREDTSRVPGNPWFVCTMWLARFQLQQARTLEDLAPGLKLLEWAARRALPSGTMAEQLHPHTGDHSRSRRSPGVTRNTCGRCRSTSTGTPA